MPSGQQYQFCSGQQPPGQTVPSQSFLVATTFFTAAILINFSLAPTKGQFEASAAQYMPSGQQYQFCSGQQPPGQTVPSQSFLAAANLINFSLAATKGQFEASAAQYMPSGQQYQFCSGQQPPGQTVPSQSFLVATTFLA